MILMPRSDDTIDLQAGLKVEGRYVLGKKLSSGGMGCVYEALHHWLGLTVAIKVLPRSALENPELLGRFLREGRILARLRHDHVVQVFDAGQLPAGPPFLVMERLHGQTLSDRLLAAGPLQIAEASRIAAQVASALAACHKLGIVHRDVKPSNLFLVHNTPQPLIKVLDFGIAKVPLSSADGGTLTDPEGVPFGTPAYMSPEHIRAWRTVDARSDIWSLGAVLFEMLTLEKPFGFAKTSIVAESILTRALPSLSDLRSDVPPELIAIVERCMQKDRAARFDSADALVSALKPFVIN